MLTRESQSSLGKALETGYVEEQAKEPLRDTSSVSNSGTCVRRHARSGTKRHTREETNISSGPSSTVPRGDTTSTKSSALPEKSGTGGNSFVFVLSANKTPLMPTTPSRAQDLLKKKKAVVHCLFPFTIRLKYRREGATQPLVLKIDPGSKKTGVALCRVSEDGTLHPLFYLELEHRGSQISKALLQRKGYRKRRRSANLRYRQPRFHNRVKPKGWLAPSLQHRVNSTLSWVSKVRRLAPISQLVTELVRFDLQQMENPEIVRAEYQ